MVAVYLGETSEEKINQMSFVFFNNVLHALGKRINYDAVTNLFGNSFAKDAWKTIQDCNPLYKPPKIGRGMMTMLDQVAIAKVDKKAKVDEFAAALFDEEAIAADLNKTDKEENADE